MERYVNASQSTFTMKVWMSYKELSTLFRLVNNKHLTSITGYIVFSSDSFDKEYNEDSRTYVVSSNNKAYQSDILGQIGFSVYASCLDGTNQRINLGKYLRGKNAWKIEMCYMLKNDYNSLLHELSRLSYEFDV